MEIVELNVGGRHFTTTRSTLCKHSGSMLAAMFSGDMQPGQQDRKGRYFIDRNGDWFALILSYLREEPLQLPPFGIQRQALLAEVRFYQDLEQQLLLGRPTWNTADEIHSAGAELQNIITKLPYQQGCTVLLQSAKMVLGSDIVHAICDALVTAFFYRDKQIVDGKQWLEAGGSNNNNLQFLDPVQVDMPEHAQHVMYRQKEVAHTKYVQRLAGVSANDLSEILTKYHILLEFEMNQRGFSLSAGWTQPRNPDQRIQAGVQWWTLMVLKPANSFCTACSRHGAKVAGVRSTFFT